MSNNYDYLKVYFDGGSRGNPGPSAVGAVVYDGKGEKLDELSLYIGEYTNNVSEYVALDKVLSLIKEYNCKRIILYTDSKLLYNQLKKIWKIKDSRILKIYMDINRKLSKYDLVDLRLIPREENKEADRLVNLALDKEEFSYKGESKIKFGKVEK